MALYTHPAFDGHEEVVFCHDAGSGLKAIIAIHNTRRGPALGGCRMWPYASEEEALTDVLRLSRGMTFKSALADLPYGGGKSVILGDPRRDKSEALLAAMAGFVESLGGRYIVAEDVGIAQADAEVMLGHTAYVAGTRTGGAGDPSPATAYGVYVGIKAAAAHRLGRAALAGLTVAVQGLGQVGSDLCRRLAEDGARLIVTDIDPAAVARAEAAFGAETSVQGVAPEAIYEAEAEIFAPCALGAVVNDETLPRLKAAIVAGSANNQLAEDRHGTALARRGILYAPDYVINAGGVIHISHEGPRYRKEDAVRHVARIQETLREIFRRAEAERIPTSQAADALALERLNSVPAAA